MDQQHPFRRIGTRTRSWRFSDGRPPDERPAWAPDPVGTYWADFTFDDPVTDRAWHLTVVMVDGPTTVDVVEVRAAAMDGAGITGEAVRSLPWGSLVADIRADWADFHASVGQLEHAERFGRRRNAITAELLQQVATVYRRHAAISKRPTQAVADAFGVPRDTASKWVRRARDAGLLGETTAGRKGEHGGEQ